MTHPIHEHDLSTVGSEVQSALARAPCHFIDGDWLPANESIAVIDPSSALPVASIARGGSVEIDAAVCAAARALRSEAWHALGPIGRERLLHRLADLIDQNAATIAQLETIDNGMPLWFSSDVVVAGASGVYRYFAGWASKLTGETMSVSAPPGFGEHLGLTCREPVGVVGAITPWNVPFMMAAWKLAPAIAAGCTVVLKPAEDTSLSALFLAQLAVEAGFPKGVFNVVTGYGHEAGEALVRHPDVAKISFTGSTATGRHIGAIAGEQLKPATLELGGKSPTIIFDDADLDRAAPGAAASVFLNSGQICVAGSRLYVQDSVYDAVIERIRTHVNTLSVGAGLNPGVFMGPLVNAMQRDRVLRYIEQARKGLEVFQGSAPQGAAGYFAPATVVTGAGQSDPITQEEIFGPVLSVYRFQTLEEVLKAANGTAYGLAAYVWSGNLSRALTTAARLECGKVMINTAGFPYPGLPEGGFKASGHGKDLGREAVEQCLRTKSVLIGTT
jgi:phenylacetaldehyde dehydrogenase